MRINNFALRGFIKARAIVTAIVFFLAGGLFLGLGIYFLVNPSPNEAGEIRHGADYASLAIGPLAIAVSVIAFILAVRGIKRQKPLSEGEVEANEQALRADAPEAESVQGEGGISSISAAN